MLLHFRQSSDSRLTQSGSEDQPDGRADRGKAGAGETGIHDLTALGLFYFPTDVVQHGIKHINRVSQDKGERSLPYSDLVVTGI